ncbi:MAG: flagellar assembly protein FliH [Hydrogenophilaceae bacterium]|nr:flagellar assembly protein FliH [Hydrogenophilaceae bacterium]
MPSRIIPKEDLTAYQRWELGVFEGQDKGASSEAEPAEEVRLPTAEDVERIHQEAWQEGYQLGEAEGRRVGEEFSQRARALFTALAQEKLQQDQELADELLQLALAIAQQVVGATFQAKPELMLETVQEALAHLPTLSGHPKLIVHPDDAAIIKDWLAHEHGHLNWRVSEDAGMQPGGFRIESMQGELDSSLPTRWQEIVAALGAKPEWLK